MSDVVRIPNCWFSHAKAHSCRCKTHYSGLGFILFYIKPIYDGLEAETRKSQASFQIIIKSHPTLCLRHDFRVEASTPSLIIFLTHHLKHFDPE